MNAEKWIAHMQYISYLAGIFPLTVYFNIGNKITGGVSLMRNPRND